MTNSLDSHLEAYQRKSLYDFDNEILLTWYPKRILAKEPNIQSVLELGLGHGFATNLFSDRFSEHLVIEGSEAVIYNFREMFPDCKVEIRNEFFETFDTSKKFDLIVMGFVLEHVEDPVLLLKKFIGLLSEKGKIYIAVPNAEVLNRRLGHLAGMLPDLTELSEHDQLLGHRRYYTVNSLTSDIEAAGLRINTLEGIYLKPFTTSQIASLNFNSSIIQALCEVGVNYPELSCGMLAEISPIK